MGYIWGHDLSPIHIMKRQVGLKSLLCPPPQGHWGLESGPEASEILARCPCRDFTPHIASEVLGLLSETVEGLVSITAVCTPPQKENKCGQEPQLSAGVSSFFWGGRCRGVFQPVSPLKGRERNLGADSILGKGLSIGVRLSVPTLYLYPPSPLTRWDSRNLLERGHRPHWQSEADQSQEGPGTAQP